MALLRRYGAHTVIAVFILYMLYSLSFPYSASPSYKPGEAPKQPETPKPQEEEQQHDTPKEPPAPKRYDWAQIPVLNPVHTLISLPKGEPLPLPRIQHEFAREDATAKQIRETRREEVKRTFLRGWRNYRARAWMHDELKPISGGAEDPFGGWAATLIDALDSLYVMGFREEFTSAMKDVEMIDFGTVAVDEVNVFETTIRHLGGLLSAYELSKEGILLKKAKELGEMLLHSFDTPNRMPKVRWNPHKKVAAERQVADSEVLVAEIGSLCMEFTRLAQLTGDQKYYDAIARIAQVFAQQQDNTKLPGMWPIKVNARKRVFTEDTVFSVGAMADSTYEYLLKEHILLGGLEPSYQKMYEKAMKTAIERTIFKPMTRENTDILMAGFVRSEHGTANLDPQMQHLVCFAGGMFALGGKVFQNKEHVNIGRKITDACVWAYKTSPSGIMPEVSHLHACPNSHDACPWDEQVWRDDINNRTKLSGTEKDPQQNIANLRLPKGFTSIDDRRYLLRPEAIESVFILYRITGEQRWQAAAWDMFVAIEKHTRTEFGNAALWDVSTESPPKADSMESYWLSETLKYFYLIFSEPNVLSLDDYVFNTEAHPFPIPKLQAKQG